jgi:hypothetical protein
VTARRPRRSTWQVYRWPLLFALLSVMGLVCALVGDGAWDVLSWLSLGVVVIAVLPALSIRARQTSSGNSPDS